MGWWLYRTGTLLLATTRRPFTCCLEKESAQHFSHSYIMVNHASKNTLLDLRVNQDCIHSVKITAHIYEQCHLFCMQNGKGSQNTF